MAARGLWLLSLIIVVFLVLLVLGAKDDNERTKKSPKKKAQKAHNTGDTYTIPPSQRSRAQWMSMPLEEVQAACDTVGVSPEGTLEALAGRLRDYYADVLAEQAIASSAQDRYHPYSSASHTDPVNPSVRQAIREHEHLLSQYNSAIDRIMQLQQPANEQIPTTSSSSAQFLSFTGISGAALPTPYGLTVAPTWSSPATFNAVPSVLAPPSWPVSNNAPGGLPTTSSAPATDFAAVLSSLRDTIANTLTNSIDAAISALGGMGGSAGGMGSHVGSSVQGGGTQLTGQHAPWLASASGGLSVDPGLSAQRQQQQQQQQQQHPWFAGSTTTTTGVQSFATKFTISSD